MNRKLLAILIFSGFISSVIAQNANTLPPNFSAAPTFIPQTNSNSYQTSAFHHRLYLGLDGGYVIQTYTGEFQTYPDFHYNSRLGMGRINFGYGHTAFKRLYLGLETNYTLMTRPSRIANTGGQSSVYIQYSTGLDAKIGYLFTPSLLLDFTTGPSWQKYIIDRYYTDGQVLPVNKNTTNATGYDYALNLSYAVTKNVVLRIGGMYTHTPKFRIDQIAVGTEYSTTSYTFNNTTFYAGVAYNFNL